MTRFKTPTPASRTDSLGRGARFITMVVRSCLPGVLAGILAGMCAAPVTAAEKPEVLLLPLKIFAPQEQHTFLRQGLRSMFVSRLTGEGLSVVSDKEMEKLLQEGDRNGIDSEGRAEELVRRAGAGYGIFGSVTTLGGGYSLDLALLDVTKTPPSLERVTEATEQDRLIPKLADVAYRFRAIIEGIDYRRLMAGGPGAATGEQGPMGLFFQATAEGQTFQPAGYTNMRMAVMSFDVADLNGDGVKEIVVTGRNKLIIAHRENENLVMKDMLNVAVGEEFLRVSLADGDKDGTFEIYLVSLYGMRAQTNVYTWNKTFQKRFRQDGHINALRDNQTGRTVFLFQNSMLNQFFSGDIYVMEYEGRGELTKKNAIDFDDGAQIHTLAYADINRDAVGEFIGLQENGYLTVWTPDGTMLWEGTTELGGSNNAVEVGERDSPDELPPRTEISGRVIAADLDGDGRREILAARNFAGFDLLERLRIYKTSRIFAYKTEGSVLEKAWSTRKINYSIADLQVVGNTIYMAGQKGQFSKMSAGESRIMWFE